MTYGWSERLVRLWARRRGGTSSKHRERLERIWAGYGFPGVVLLSPLLVGALLGTLLAPLLGAWSALLPPARLRDRIHYLAVGAGWGQDGPAPGSTLAPTPSPSEHVASTETYGASTSASVAPAKAIANARAIAAVLFFTVLLVRGLGGVSARAPKSFNRRWPASTMKRPTERPRRFACLGSRHVRHLITP